MDSWRLPKLAYAVGTNILKCCLIHTLVPKILQITCGKLMKYISEALTPSKFEELKKIDCPFCLDDHKDWESLAGWVCWEIKKRANIFSSDMIISSFSSSLLDCKWIYERSYIHKSIINQSIINHKFIVNLIVSFRLSESNHGGGISCLSIWGKYFKKL